MATNRLRDWTNKDILAIPIKWRWGKRRIDAGEIETRKAEDMRLTLRTDYALRVLIQLALAPERLGSIRAIAAAYGISENHLMNVVHNLV